VPPVLAAHVTAGDGQTYRERPPAPAAAAYVSTAWVQLVDHGAAAYTHRTVPHGSIELSVEVGALPRVVGPQTGPVIETLAPGTTVVGVRFQPGAAPAVLGLPASELVDRDVAWDEIPGRSAVEVGEAVAAAPSPEQALAILEQAVVRLLARAEAPDPIVTGVVRELLPWGRTEVGSLTSALSISERQLRRRTLAGIGLSPKALHRMLRFQGFLALAQAHARRGADLALLAADTGYADQSHLTRESLRLTGLTPRALLREADENCVGIHDHTASRVPLLRTRALRHAAALRRRA
jgi:AraC-like DNA-binding protein